MFTLKNAWASLCRHPYRSLLLTLVATVVAACSIFAFAILQEDHYAHGDALKERSAVVQIRADRQAREASLAAGDDSKQGTKHYLSWEQYTAIAKQVQASGLQFSYSVALSVPVGSGSKLEPVTVANTAAQSVDANKTGGDLRLTAFYDVTTQPYSDYGNFTVTQGKPLDYAEQTGLDGAMPVLVSGKLAKANNLKVGDSFKVTDPADTGTTYECTVQGIYDYTGDDYADLESHAKYTKDLRDNVLYTTYASFATHQLDDVAATGWDKPDLNVLFSLNNAQDVGKFEKAVRTAGVDADFTVSSPTLDAYNDSLRQLDASAGWMRILLACAWIAGGLLVLGLVLLAVLPRREEIGHAMLLGASRGRLGWQLMLETLLPLLAGLLLGTLIGATATNPSASSLAGGHTVRVSGHLVGTCLWVGALVALGFALLAAIRAALFNPRALFVSPYVDTDTDNR